eukprot:jgi/Bigna1/132328/aug1.17_g7036
MLVAMKELVDPKIGSAYRAFLLLDYRTLKEKRYTQANVDYPNFMKYRLPPNQTSSYDARAQSDTTGEREVGDFGADGLTGMKAWPCICSVVSPEASKAFKDLTLSKQYVKFQSKKKRKKKNEKITVKNVLGTELSSPVDSYQSIRAKIEKNNCLDEVLLLRPDAFNETTTREIKNNGVKQ